MTSEFVLERMGALMDLLGAIPEGDSIVRIDIAERDICEKQMYGSCDVSIHLSRDVDIQTVAHSLGLPVLVDSDTYQEYGALKVVDPQYVFQIFQLVDKPRRK